MQALVLHLLFLCAASEGPVWYKPEQPVGGPGLHSGGQLREARQHSGRP